MPALSCRLVVPFVVLGAFGGAEDALGSGEDDAADWAKALGDLVEGTANATAAAWLRPFAVGREEPQEPQEPDVFAQADALAVAGPFKTAHRVVRVPRFWNGAGPVSRASLKEACGFRACAGAFDVHIVYPVADENVPVGPPRHTDFLRPNGQGPPLLWPVPAVAASMKSSDDDDGWPLLVFGIGWASWTMRYVYTMAHLASHGIVVAAPMSADRALAPSFRRFYEDLLSTASFLTLRTSAGFARAGPPPWLFGRIAGTSVALAGHSSGGGAAISAAAAWRAEKQRRLFHGENVDALTFALRQVVLLSPSDLVSPDSDWRAVAPDVPVVILAGDADRITPLSRIKATMLKLPPSAPLSLVVLVNGSHCFLDPEAFPLVRRRRSVPQPASDCDAAYARGSAMASPRAQLVWSRAWFARALSRPLLSRALPLPRAPSVWSASEGAVAGGATLVAHRG